MKLTANFKLDPLDVFTATDNNIQPADAVEMNQRADRILAGDRFTDEEWRWLHLTRYTGSPAIIDYTGEETEINGLPVIKWDNRVYGKYNWDLGRKVMVVLTPGTILFKHCWRAGDRQCKPVVCNMLEEMGIEGLEYSKEIEINDMKIGGFVNREFSKGKMMTEGSIIFGYDDEVFMKLPDLHYSRSYLPGKKPGKRGITGLEIESPGFLINDFLTEFINRMGYGNIDIFSENMPFPGDVIKL